MKRNSSLSHTVWACKYHMVWIPKYRRNVLYGKYGIIWEMCFTNWRVNAKAGKSKVISVLITYICVL